MKVIRVLLQIVLVASFLFVGVFFAIMFSGVVTESPSDELAEILEILIYHTPNGVLSLLLTVIGLYFDTALEFLAWISVTALFLHILPSIGVLLRGKSRWAYRVLVYPTILLSVLTSLMYFPTGLIAAIAYLVIAIAIDALP